MLSSLARLLKRENFIFFNIIFLICLAFNINNKTLIFVSFVYLIISSLIQKSFTKGLIFSYLLFSLFLVGKTYEIQIIPKSKLAYAPILGYNGYYQGIIIGASFFIGILMFMPLLSQLVKKSFSFQKDILFLSLFIIFSLVSSILSLNTYLSLFAWFNTLFLLPFYYLLKKYLLADKKFIFDLLRFLGVLASYEVLLAAIQYVKKGSALPSLEIVSQIPFQGLELDPNWFRPPGSLSHPNDLANFLLPLTVLFFLIGYLRKKIPKNFAIFGFTLGIFGLILTLSRSSWLILFFILIISVFVFEKKYHLQFNSKYKKMIVFIVLILIPIFFLFAFPRIGKSLDTFSEGGSGLSRIELIQESVNLSFRYPLFGVGYRMSVLGMFLENPKGEMYYFPTPVHNIYLQMTNELGILPTVSFFSFLGYLIFKGRKNGRDLNRKIIKDIALFSFLSILLNGIFQPIYATTLLYLVIFALIHYVF
ncbi:MAG: O-antigen ligase family protein [bacterium]|nr:O-antigen ligase family protein [bacterium]